MTDHLTEYLIDLRDARINYLRHGYVVIPEVFDKLDCDLVRSEAKWLAEHYPQSVQRAPNGGPALLFWPSQVNTHLSIVKNDIRLSSIVKFFLGTEVRQINNQVYFRRGGDGDQFAWHQDIMFRSPEDFHHEGPNGIDANYLQTVIVVDEMSEDNGAIEFIPGSHTRGNLHLIPSETHPGLRKFVRNSQRGIKVKAQPGDVILWSPLVIHGSEPNTSGAPRMTYMNGFAAECAVKNKDKYPVYKT